MSSQLFRNLHRGPGLLLLPNAWDAGSARLIESLGAKAIATTSAGLAWSRGYPDGNALPEDQLIAAIRDMARVIRVPLTVDIEGGYSDDPAAVARLVARVLAVGVVGINIEDGERSPDLLCKKIAAIRDHVAHSGADVFINTRTDVYLRGVARGEAATAEVIRRASRYRGRHGGNLCGDCADAPQCNGRSEFAAAGYARKERCSTAQRGLLNRAGGDRSHE